MFSGVSVGGAVRRSRRRRSRLVATVVFRFRDTGDDVGGNRISRGGGIAGVVVSYERANRVRRREERE